MLSDLLVIHLDESGNSTDEAHQFLTLGDSYPTVPVSTPPRGLEGPTNRHHWTSNTMSKCGTKEPTMQRIGITMKNLLLRLANDFGLWYIQMTLANDLRLLHIQMTLTFAYNY